MQRLPTESGIEKVGQRTSLADVKPGCRNFHWPSSGKPDLLDEKEPAVAIEDPEAGAGMRDGHWATFPGIVAAKTVRQSSGQGH